MINDNFKYPVINTLKTLEAPAFDEPLDESAESVMSYLKRIQDYMKSFDVNEVEDYNAHELRQAADALQALSIQAMDTSSAISAFQVKIDDLAYNKEKEEESEEESERISSEHTSYMYSWYNSTRM